MELSLFYCNVYYTQLRKMKTCKQCLNSVINLVYRLSTYELQNIMFCVSEAKKISVGLKI